MGMSGGSCLWSYGSLLFISSFFLFVYGSVQSVDDEWIDPYDMINYDSTSKSMRKPAEASSYNNVPTKRREYSQDSCQVAQCPDIKECTNTVNRLQQEVEEHRRRVTFSSHQPTCNPVFKRFLAKLLKEIEKLGLPTAITASVHYDAEVKLSRQMVAEMQKLVNDENTWRTGALDDALSQMLINFKLHDHEAWKWRFEDTFGVELDTVIKVLGVVLIIVCIICTEMWSMVSWFVQFKRLFAICFFISLVWNWFYLYKIAFAEHQANIVKMENINHKCTGVKKIDWMHNIKEFFRTTFTLQDDPCKQYYEVLIVNPILLVPPTKAITITITTFITDPLKHLGQGISEFLRALLKDLPITLQIPVLITIVLSILVFMYSTGQAVIQHAVFRPLRGGRRDPPTGIAQQPAASQNDNRPEICQRRSNRPRLEQQKVHVETLRNADSPYSGDETDTHQEAAAEDMVQHVEEEPLTPEHQPKEENETSASVPVTKHCQPASKEHSAKSNAKENKKSGDTKRNEEGDSVNASKKEKIENIGTPVQESML